MSGHLALSGLLAVGGARGVNWPTFAGSRKQALAEARLPSPSDLPMMVDQSKLPPNVKRLHHWAEAHLLGRLFAYRTTHLKGPVCNTRGAY
jgi:hypothetical protein